MGGDGLHGKPRLIICIFFRGCKNRQGFFGLGPEFDYSSPL